MKKIISLILMLCISFSCCGVYVMAEEIDVYVTVSDITDFTLPINILVPRHKITVSEFNLAEFGDTLTGIECIEGITYLHALVQLHRNLYGDENVSENLLLTSDGVTKIFMGKSVANVMYKNGKDIFALPQLINISDGDEIQVCLYNEGHSQAIAAFNEARLDNVSPNETIQLTLQEHYGHPRDREPIVNAEITDENGNYITDENGDIITTDNNGNFDVSFQQEGSYTLSAAPIINYYLKDKGGGIIVEWIPQTTTTKNDKYILYAGELYDIVYGDEENGHIILFEWEEPEKEPLIISEENIPEYITTTELVKVETVLSDDLKPMVTYTTPFVTVNVTKDLSISDVYLVGNTLNISIKNSEYHSTDDLYVAGYILAEDRTERFGEVKMVSIVEDRVNVGFSRAYDKYKIFAWENGTMTPIMTAASYIPADAAAVMSIDYDYTLTMPENTYITSK